MVAEHLADLHQARAAPQHLRGDGVAKPVSPDWADPGPLAGSHHHLSQILGFVAVTCATINVVGGFLITDRMLRMFRRKPDAKAAPVDPGLPGKP